MSKPKKPALQFQHQNGFILRTPLLSLKHANIQPASVERFESGLLLSSKALWQQHQKYEHLNPAEKTKLDRSVYKYWLRASTRATPYGTFAGVAKGTISDEPSSFTLSSTEELRIALRMDMQVLSKIIAQIQSDTKVREHLTYTANNSLYPVPGGYRYAEWQLKNDVRNYQLSEIAGSQALDLILNVVQKPTSLKELRNLLLNETESEAAEIDNFFGELIDSQVLISSLEVCITGPDTLSKIIEELSRIPEAQSIRESLLHIQKLIQKNDCSTDQIAGLVEAIEQTKLINDTALTNLQADTFLTSKEVQLSDEIASAILHQVDSLSVFAQSNSSTDLEEFKKRFAERYEGQTVPLNIAMDADLGIGYGGVTHDSTGNNSLIEDLPIVQSTSHRNTFQTPLTELALRKYEAWKVKSETQITLTDEDLAGISEPNKKANWPASMFAMGSLLGQNNRLEKDSFQFDVSVATGPSAANLLGRFAYGDKTIQEFLHELLLKEEESHPDCILAEIAHNPQERIGNIQFRPLLRRYEIPYVGISGAPDEHQIPVNDLWLKKEGSELILFSKKHNKRVLPRLSTAHNFSARSLPIYKFLCDLQRQHTLSFVPWDWGTLDVLKQLPRVTYKNLILKKARWIADEKDIQNNMLDQWKSDSGIPDRVTIVDGDNDLLIDFTIQNGRELFLHSIKKQKRILLEEFLFNEENAIVRNEAGEGFTNEIIIPFNTNQIQHNKTVDLSPTTSTIQRKFTPGSEWVYFKVYCGPKTAEELLVKHMLPFIKDSFKSELFAKFFFIRYRDEASHLRIRFYCPDKLRRYQLTDAFYHMMETHLNDGTVSRICIDTYVREIERYGSDGIEVAESIFHHDSIATLEFLHLLHACEDEHYRLSFALRGTDILLDDFGLNCSGKHKLLKDLQKAFFEEFGGSPDLQKSLNSRYRDIQKSIASHLDECNDEQNDISEAVAVFQKRSILNAPLVEFIQSSTSKRQWEDWLRSYIHMSLNRLFISDQRKHELLVYHFLEKHYASQLAREHAVKKPELVIS